MTKKSCINRSRGWASTCLGIAAAGSIGIVAGAQQDQRVFGTSVDDNQPARISHIPSGGMVSCGNDVITLHDGIGAVQWMMNIDGFYPQASIPTADGGLAVAGSLVVDNGLQCMLVKITLAGTVDWMHLYPGYNLSEALDLIEVGDKEGYLIALENLDGNGSRIPMLIRTKADGNVIWMNNYEAPGIQNAMGEFSFVEMGRTADGEVNFNLTGKLGPFPGNMDTLLARVDANGNPMVSRQVGFTDHSDFGRGLTEANEGGYLVTGYSKQAGEGGGTYLMHVDDNFNLNWYRSMYGFRGTKEIYQDADSNAHLVGALSFPNPTSNMSLVAVHTPSQSYMWGMQYGGTDNDGASDYAVTPNGFLIYGSTRSFDIIPNQDYYLAMTDFAGISGCNESDLKVDLIPFAPANPGVQLVAVSLPEVAQELPGWQLINFVDRDICVDPKPCVCVDPPADMIGWWTMDELVNPTSADSIAGNDGIHMDDATPAPGKVANGIKLDGDMDYVLVLNDPILEVPAADQSTGDGDFSIDAWIKIEDQATLDWGGITDKRDWGTGPGYSFFVHNSRLHLFMSDGVNVSLHQSVQMLTMGDYIHVGVAVDRTAGFNVRFIVNGIEDVDSTPISVLGSLGNPDADLWIGAMRYTSAPGTPEDFFTGIIDEVEIFNRALDTSEFAGLFTADECGKCKFGCDVPWDIPFCQSDLKVVSTVILDNLSPNPTTFELSFNGIPAPGCGNIDGPSMITVIAPSNPVTVAGNTSIPVQISIERPAMMNSLYDTGCFEVVVTNLDTGSVESCTGSVIDRRDLCPDTPVPNGPWVEMVPDRDIEIQIPITNTGDPIGDIRWRAVVYGPDMEVSRNIGVNGNEPGEYAEGMTIARLGETGTVFLKVRADEFEGLDISDLVLFTESDNQLYPLTSVALRTVLESDAPCDGDVNGDGVIDGADLASLLGAWGKCEGCPEDIDGNGVVDGADLATVLGAWGLCP